MVHYKKSAVAAVASASLVAAQNDTIINNNNINIQINNFNFDYTTVIPQLCPTGWEDQTFTIHQACPTECGQPDIPLGWDIVTAHCEYGCGPEPTEVTVTSCPYTGATAYPKPDDVCDDCHVNIVEYAPPVPKDCKDDCAPSVVTCATIISTPVTCPTPEPDYDEECEDEEAEEAPKPVAPAPAPPASAPEGGEAPAAPAPAPAPEGCKPNETCEETAPEQQAPAPYTGGSDKVVAGAASVLLGCALAVAGLL